MERDKRLLYSENAANYIESSLLISYTSYLVYLNFARYKVNGLTYNLVLLQFVGSVCFGLSSILETFVDYHRAN